MCGRKGPCGPSGRVKVFGPSGPLKQAMARKRRGRRNSTFFQSRDTVGLALGTLANLIVVKATPPTMDQDILVHSVKLNAMLRGFTVGEGPLMIGVAQDILTVTEIKEALDASPSSQYDVPAVEQAGRKVRILGIFDGVEVNERLNDGKAVTARLNWKIPDDQNLPSIWVMNMDSASSLTTGAVVQSQITYNCSWK